MSHLSIQTETGIRTEVLTVRARYACDTVGAVLMVGVAAAAVFAFVKLPRVPRASLLWIIVLAPLLVRPSHLTSPPIPVILTCPPALPGRRGRVPHYNPHAQHDVPFLPGPWGAEHARGEGGLLRVPRRARVPLRRRAHGPQRAPRVRDWDVGRPPHGGPKAQA